MNVKKLFTVVDYPSPYPSKSDRIYHLEAIPCGSEIPSHGVVLGKVYAETEMQAKRAFTEPYKWPDGTVT